MILSRDGKGEQNVWNIILISSVNVFMRNFFYEKLVSVLLYLSVESLSYSNLYEHFRTKLQDFIKCNWR